MKTQITPIGWALIGAVVVLLIGAAAAPIYTPWQAFRGTGGIVITTNPATLSVTVDGSSISSPTGGVSAATVTNIVDSKGLTTNANQFLGAPLSIKSGVLETNVQHYGTTLINGIQTNNNNVDINGTIQTWDGAGNKVIAIGNDPVTTRILSTGTGLSLQSQFGVIELKDPSKISSTLADGANSVGVAGQLLTSTGTGVGWSNAPAGTGGSLTTNANQFLGVPLSIKKGASTTNFNGFGSGTNHTDFYVEGIERISGALDFPSLTGGYISANGQGRISWNALGDMLFTPNVGGRSMVLYADGSFSVGDASTPMNVTNSGNLMVLGTITGNGSGLTNINATNVYGAATFSSITTTGSAPGGIAFSNSTQSAVVTIGPTNTVTVTNYLGVVHLAAASVLALDANQSANWTQTNRVTGAQTIVVTNGSDGQELSMIIPGEVSGGTSRVMTFISNTGQLVADEDTFGTALATSKALTLTNGNFVEMRDTVRRVNGTNVHFIATRQGAF